MPRSNTTRDFPSNWKLLKHILALYRDVNLVLREINESYSINPSVATILMRIINQLRAISMLRETVSMYFLAYLHLNIFLSEDSLRDIQQLKRFLVTVQNALEKIIASNGKLMVLHRKDATISLRHSAVSLFVPDGFDALIPSYKYIPGTTPVILTAPHAAPPQSDTFTGRLALLVAKRTSSHALISTIPRFISDPNRMLGRIWPFRRILEKLIDENKIRLIIDLHSSNNAKENSVEIGTWYGFSILRKHLNMLLDTLEENNITYTINSRFTGGDITFYHSNIPFVSAIQLEISGGQDRKSLLKIAHSLVEFIRRFNGVRKNGGIR
ncbi:MAG: hypothetical protein QW819_00840 [Candidatus Korarchaeota archaeon]|nr:hypothetical protein [Thermoproteota archaeon]MCR8473030.1 hypothetical protein [Thermoproteota archaeon]MCR8488359.1 hypothetical protein [Thermoproteota archaeon]